MTEAEWLACADALEMLEPLKGRASDRKLRLFACGCCRQVWDSFPMAQARKTVEVAEQFADDATTGAAITHARERCYEALARYQRRTFPGFANRHETAIELRFRLAAEAAHLHQPFLVGRLRMLNWTRYDPELRPLTRLIARCVFGNPFRPVALALDRITDTAVAIAKEMYGSRDFSAMPILADALQDAGCDSTEILEHCRGPDPHVRGCWVVDLILGKQ